MNTNIVTTTRAYMHKHIGHVVTFMSSAFIVLALALGFTQFASAAYSPITAQVAPGASGTNVTNVQLFLASNPSFYPEGLVTGFYGALTQAAVQRFQAFYGIVSSGSPSSTGYGRVGPSTLAKMNELIMGGMTTSDMSAPYISGVTIATGSNTASVTWNTNELATGRLYYSTSPISFNEGNENSAGFAVTSGQSASYDVVNRVNNSTSLSGLSANTTYYYLIVATDAAGNVSISTPGATFRTGM